MFNEPTSEILISRNRKVTDRMYFKISMNNYVRDIVD